MDNEERREQLLRRLHKNPENRKGMVAMADEHSEGQIHWTQASTLTENGVSTLKGGPTQIEFDKGPPIIKRSPQARVESLTRKLLDHIEDSYKVYGEPRIPEDLVNMIKEEYWKNGEPFKTDGVNVEALKAVAVKLMQEAERRAN